MSLFLCEWFWCGCDNLLGFFCQPCTHNGIEDFHWYFKIIICFVVHFTFSWLLTCQLAPESSVIDNGYFQSLFSVLNEIIYFQCQNSLVSDIKQIHTLNTTSIVTDTQARWWSRRLAATELVVTSWYYRQVWLVMQSPQNFLVGEKAWVSWLLIWGQTKERKTLLTSSGCSLLSRKYLLKTWSVLAQRQKPLRDQEAVYL